DAIVRRTCSDGGAAQQRNENSASVGDKSKHGGSVGDDGTGGAIMMRSTALAAEKAGPASAAKSTARAHERARQKTALTRFSPVAYRRTPASIVSKLAVIWVLRALHPWRKRNNERVVH